MSEKLKKLIKPMIAAAVVVIVLIIAYFSGGDVSVDDRPDPRPAAETTSITTTASSATAAISSTVSTSASAGTSKTSTAKTTASSAAETAVSKTSATARTVTTASVAKTETSAFSAVTTVVTPPVTEPVSVTPVTTTTAAKVPDTGDHCTVSISCETVFDNTDKIDPAILAEQPSGGKIISPVKVTVNDGDTVFDVLKRICSDNGIHLEYTKIAATNNYYIEGINNLYEFDAGNLSGWMYSVNGKFPQLSSSQYAVSDGDVIEFVYSCNIGVDVGDDYFTKAG